MNIRLLRIIFCIFLVVLAGCNQASTTKRFLGIGEGDNSVSSAEHLKGTEALVISLGDGRTIQISPSQSLIFDFSIENKGSHSVETTKATFSGFDPQILTGVDFSSGKLQRLQGKSQYGPGQQEFYSVKGSAGIITGQRLRQDITLNICYPYQTIATFEVCVDGNGRDEPNGCPRDANYALSGGQGAPVGVNSVQYTSRRNENGARATFVIHLGQLSTSNNLQILDSTNYPKYCPERGTQVPQTGDFRQDSGVVLIREIKLGTQSIPLHNCPSLLDGKFNIERRSDLICYLDVNAGADYTTSFDVVLEYGVKQSITQPVLVEKLEGVQ